MLLIARNGSPSAITTIRVIADSNVVSVYSSGEDLSLNHNCTIPEGFRHCQEKYRSNILAVRNLTNNDTNTYRSFAATMTLLKNCNFGAAYKKKQKYKGEKQGRTYFTLLYN